MKSIFLLLSSLTVSTLRWHAGLSKHGSQPSQQGSLNYQDRLILDLNYLHFHHAYSLEFYFAFGLIFVE